MGTEKKKNSQESANAEEKVILTKLSGFYIFTQQINLDGLALRNKVV